MPRLYVSLLAYLAYGCTLCDVLNTRTLTIGQVVYFSLPGWAWLCGDECWLLNRCTRARIPIEARNFKLAINVNKSV